MYNPLNTVVFPDDIRDWILSNRRAPSRNDHCVTVLWKLSLCYHINCARLNSMGCSNWTYGMRKVLGRTLKFKPLYLYS